MVGDLQRLLKYPAMGFMCDGVVSAMSQLLLLLLNCMELAPFAMLTLISISPAQGTHPHPSTCAGSVRAAG
jgi:hypothetical protein